jgi:hypothetical protein
MYFIAAGSAVWSQYGLGVSPSRVTDLYLGTSASALGRYVRPKHQEVKIHKDTVQSSQ